MPVNLFIARQRNGPVRDISLIFHRGHTPFELAAHSIDPGAVPYERRPKSPTYTPDDTEHARAAARAGTPAG